MSGTIIIDTSDFVQFSRRLRQAAPRLSRRLRSNIGRAGRATATTMRAGVPHQHSTGNWGPLRGVRFSDAASSKGGAIVVSHVAYTFGVGNRGPGRYKHPTWGRWSSSPKTIMATSDFIVKGAAELLPGLQLAAEAAVQSTIDELAFGAGDVESDLGNA